MKSPTCRSHAADPIRSRPDGQTEWEEYLIESIRQRPIEATAKSALILARRGQGLFKQRVRQVERRCRITGVERIEHLRASHCKPWRDSSDPEHLDGENGLLLTPSIDHLFDRRFIAFEADGRLLVSPVFGVSSGESVFGGKRKAVTQTFANHPETQACRLTC